MNFLTKSLKYPSLILLFCFSCKSKTALTLPDPFQSITKHVSYSSFPQQQNLQLHATGVSGFFSTLAVMDSFLLCADLRAPLIIQVVDIKNNRKLGDIIRRGNGKGECLSVANILPTDQKNIFWIYDITLGKFQKINLLKALKDSAYQPEEEFMLTGMAKRAKSPVWINDSTFAACSYLFNDARFFYFNKRSEILKKTGQLPPANQDWPPDTHPSQFSLLASIFTVGMGRLPGKDNFVLAYNKTDRIELYQEGQLKRIVRGPDNFDPVVSFKEDNGEMMADENNKTRFSYVNLFAAGKYIYAIYSGEQNFNTCGQKILVYDSDGNPVKVLNLNNSYCCLTLAGEGSQVALYAMQNGTGALCRTEISN